MCTTFVNGDVNLCNLCKLCNMCKRKQEKEKEKLDLNSGRVRVEAVASKANVHPFSFEWSGGGKGRGDFLVDSGAGVCALGQNMVEELGLSVHAIPAGLPKSVNLADGSPSQVIGAVELSILLKDRVFTIEFIVLKNVTTPILGLNFIQAVNNELGERKSMFLFRRVESDVVGNWACSSLGVMKSLLSSRWRVKSLERLEISDEVVWAQAEAWIPASACLSRNLGLGSFVAEFIPKANKFGDLLLAPQTVEVMVDWSKDAVVRGPSRRLRRVVCKLQILGSGLLRKNKGLGCISLLEVQDMKFVDSQVSVSVNSVYSESSVDSVVENEGMSDDSVCKKLVERTLQNEFCVASNEEQKKSIADCIESFGWSEELSKAGQISVGEASIYIEPWKAPVAKKNWRMGSSDVEFVENEIVKLLAQEAIRISTSPWNSPIMVVRHKRTRKQRLVFDFRGVNPLSEVERWPLANKLDIFAVISKARVFSFLDLASAYHQMPLNEQSKKFTAFSAPRGGHYEFNVGCFGLKNMPGAYQRMMELLLSDHLWKFVIVYIDDIILFTETLEEHLDVFAKVRRLLDKANIVLRASKCNLFRSQGSCLGLWFGHGKVSLLDSAVSGFQNIKIPSGKNVKKMLRSFMGVANSISSFVPFLPLVGAPLYEMMSVNAKIKCDLSEGSIGELAFNSLKSLMQNPASLSLPKLFEPFYVFVDAAEPAACAAVLQLKEGKKLDVEKVVEVEELFDALQLVCFLNVSFGRERFRWSIPVKEAFAPKHFICDTFLESWLLNGSHYLLVDAPISKKLLGQRSFTDRKLANWAVQLSKFDLKVVQVASKLNLADFGTREPFGRTAAKLLNKYLHNPLVESWNMNRLERCGGRQAETSVSVLQAELIQPPVIDEQLQKLLDLKKLDSVLVGGSKKERDFVEEVSFQILADTPIWSQFNVELEFLEVKLL